MRNPRWTKVRAASQLAFWTIFILMIIRMRFPMEDTAPYQLILRISAHLGISASIGAGTFLWSFIPGFILLALAIPLGRYFCGWVCPLGSTIDNTARLISTKSQGAQKKKNRDGTRRWKYIVLIICLAASAAGIQLSGILDPLSLAVRSFTVLYSYFDSLIKLIVHGVSKIPFLESGADRVLLLLKDGFLDTNEIAFQWHGAVFALFLIVLGLSFFSTRFWCRYLCPLGACHALVSNIGFFRRIVDFSRCTNCLACERECPMGAIHEKGTATDESNCIKCLKCLTSCKYDAIRFGFSYPWKQSKPAERIPEGRGFTRRDVMITLAGTVIALPLMKSGADAENSSVNLIRPPGAGSEDDFKGLCIRCGMCMKVCPTNGLHPVLFESGIDGAFTPKLIPRIGWCELNCNLCSQVCPTGALRKVEIDEREKLIIGTAYIIRDLCIPYSEDRECIVCEEMCPTATKSIKFTEETRIRPDGTAITLKLPYVLENICVGCGICEHKCPVRGSAAIQVRRRKHEPKP